MVTIYTDGACSGNPGPGGWGVLLKYRHATKKLSGAMWDTTNNKMELFAAIEGLKVLKRRCDVTITTDSNYVKRGITEWIEKWKQQGWKTYSKKPLKNCELWKELDELVNKHNVTWKWVKGHSGHTENEIVDSLAREAITKLIKEAN